MIPNATFTADVPTTRTQTGTLGYVNTAASATNTTNGISMIAGINSHNWYGGILNLNKKLDKNFTLDFGVDVRTYKGIHTRNLNDLLGGTTFLDTADKNNPSVYVNTTSSAKPSWNPFYVVTKDKAIIRNYDGLVNWYGGFTQLEYSKDNLTAFIQGAVSSQGFKRVDRFSYLATDPLSETDFKNILGGNVKGGANYNIGENHNVFVNSGYYSKQPFFSSVYPNNLSLVNENLTNEKIFGLELGYGYRSQKFNANLNFYRTSWKDRFLTTSANIDDDGLASTPTVRGTAFLEGIEQIHMGGEFDFVYKPIKRLNINGSLSIGNWKYGSDVTASYQDANGGVIKNPSGTPFSETLYIDGLKVGNTAQTTASIGASFEVIERVIIDGNYNFVDNLYAKIDADKFKTKVLSDQGSLKVPSYGLVDAGFSYKMLIGKNKSNSVNFRLNVNNLLDKIYISESASNQFTATEAEFNGNTGNGSGLKGAIASPTKYTTYADYQNRGIYKGTDVRNNVNFGFGRTWNFSLRYNF